jgi:hypothetical protein
MFVGADTWRRGYGLRDAWIKIAWQILDVLRTEFSYALTTLALRL